MTFAHIQRTELKRRINDILFHLLMSIVENLRHRRIFAPFFLSLLLIAVANGARAGWQQTVSSQLLQQWQAISGRQDKARISYPGLPADYRLADCPAGITIDLVRPLQPGRNGVELSCRQPYWKQHLAIQLHVLRDVAVLAQNVNAGSALQSEDIRYIEQDTGELNRGFYTEGDALAGMIVRRSFRSGTVLSPDMIEDPLVIRRGETVVILIDRPGIHIEMKGTALADSSAGEQIRVRNNQSGKIITATAVRAGLVQVR